MSKIVEFPTHRLPSQVIRKDLDELKEALKSCYENVEEAYETIQKMEEDLLEVESIYNEKLLQLAELVGAANITVQDLEFATNLTVSCDSTGLMTFQFNDPDGVEAGSWVFTPEGGDNIVFIPEGEDPNE
jgi:hypothetical protein